MNKLILTTVFLFSLNALASPFEYTNLSPKGMFYVPPPYEYENNEIAVIQITSNAEILRKLVPEPLVPNVDNTIYFYIGDFNLKKPFPLQYKEAGLHIPVTYNLNGKEEHGGYFPVLYLNHIDAIIGARDIYGFPKILADVSFERDDNKISGFVKVDGEIIIDVKFDLTSEIEDAHLPAWDMLTFKRVPAADLKDDDLAKQIIKTRQNGIKIHSMHSATADLKLFSNLRNPLDKITIINQSNPSFRIESMKINEGNVLYDYIDK